MSNIYLDNAATTRIDPGAMQKTLQFMLGDGFYNPSALYKSGRAISSKIEEARRKICSYFSNEHSLVFTSCGSEADNMAIFSFAKRGNVITSQGEHSAVYNSFNQVKQMGVEVRYAPLNKNGSVNVEKLLELVDEKTTFVSIVHVNNETGAINDINAIAKRIKEKNKQIIFHSDGVQAFLKLPHKLSKDVDLYAISAHKIGGLKGVGALIYKKNLHMKPIIYGGGQEKGLRSGTENTFGIFMLEEVFSAQVDKVAANFTKANELKKAFFDAVGDDVVFISDCNCSPYVISLSVPGVKGEILQRMLEDRGIIVGTGSACSSKIGVSRIILACGITQNTAEGVLRISFSYNSTIDEVVAAGKAISECALKMRKVLK